MRSVRVSARLISYTALAALLLLAGGAAQRTIITAPHTQHSRSLSSQHMSRAPQPTTDATSDNRPLAALAPARLVIPKLGLNAPILALDPDPSGAMQAPRIGGPSNPIWSEVYWWDVGARPGAIGNAVIAGHVNRPDASPSTFTHLNRLVPGDTVQVVTAGGLALSFRVTAKDTPSVYVHGGNDPTIERIFGPALTPNLNLMTCWGAWDGAEFNQRLVIYSTLIGPSPFPSPAGVPLAR